MPHGPIDVTRLPGLPHPETGRRSVVKLVTFLVSKHGLQEVSPLA